MWSQSGLQFINKVFYSWQSDNGECSCGQNMLRPPKALIVNIILVRLQMLPIDGDKLSEQFKKLI